MRILAYFTPTIDQFAGLLAVLATFVLFAMIGGLVGGPRRFRQLDVFVGWGVVNMAFTVLGVFSAIPFTWIFYGLWAMGLCGGLLSWRRDRKQKADGFATSEMWRIGVLILPFVLLATAMRASQWDEFSQWLLNAQYLLQYDAFPRNGLPVNPSGHSAYPYGLPLITYLASKLAGGFVENAGGLANLLLLVSLAPAFVHIVGTGLEASQNWLKSWGAAALGLLGVTVLTTTFVQKLVLTAYADSATAATLAAVGVLVWKLLDTLGERPPEKGTRTGALAWQFAWVSAVLINLKQPNLVLLVLLLAGMALVVIRDPLVRIAEILRRLPVMLGPTVVVYLAWRYHVSHNLSGGEFSLIPFDGWLIPQAFEILQRMLLIASKKGAYFVMMAILVVFAVRGFMRTQGSFDRFAILAGGVFAGYTLFLWFMYVAAFGPGEGLRAASYWRYNTQLGPLGAFCAAFGLSILWRRHARRKLADWNVPARLLPALAVILVVTMPAVAGKSLRFDIRPQKDHMRMVGQEMARTLPDGARLVIIDPRGNGFADQVIRYELASGGGSGRGLKATYRFNVLKPPASELDEILERKAITHAWVHQPLDGVRAALGIELPALNSHLLRRAGKGWELLRSWPYGGYEDPYSLPD